MALIRHLKKSTMDRNSLHGEVEAAYSVFENDGRYILQIDTFGSDEREIPGKKSQTIQFGPEGLSQLRKILDDIRP